MAQPLGRILILILDQPVTHPGSLVSPSPDVQKACDANLLEWDQVRYLLGLGQPHEYSGTRLTSPGRKTPDGLNFVPCLRFSGGRFNLTQRIKSYIGHGQIVSFCSGNCGEELRTLEAKTPGYQRRMNNVPRRLQYLQSGLVDSQRGHLDHFPLLLACVGSILSSTIPVPFHFQSRFNANGRQPPRSPTYSGSRMQIRSTLCALDPHHPTTHHQAQPHKTKCRLPLCVWLRACVSFLVPFL